MSGMGEKRQLSPPSSPNYKKLKIKNYTGIHFTALMIVFVITNKIIYMIGKAQEMPPDKKFYINEDNVISAA